MEKRQSLIQQKKVIFLHIPKAGGSTLIEILRKVYSDEKFVHVWSKGEIKEDFQLRRLRGYKFDIVVGHLAFGVHKFIKYPVQYITVLREPIERLISHYNYVKRRPEHELHDELITNEVSLADYLLNPRSHEMDNGQVRQLVDSEKPIGAITQEDLEEAKQNLLNFFVFGTLKNWDMTLKKFEANLGWDKIPEYEIINSAKTKETKLTDSELEKIKVINKYDIALYNFVKDRN